MEGNRILKDTAIAFLVVAVFWSIYLLGSRPGTWVVYSTIAAVALARVVFIYIRRRS